MLLSSLSHPSMISTSDGFASRLKTISGGERYISPARSPPWNVKVMLCDEGVEMPAVYVDVTPSVLIWARETAGLEVDDAAPRLQLTTDALVALEDGSSQPTMGALDRMTVVYRRAFTVLLLPAPPPDELLEDFRTVDGHSPPWNTDIAGVVRSSRRWRQSAAWLADELDELEPLKLRASTTTENPEAIADLVRAKILPSDSYFRFEDGQADAWNARRSAVEKLGILVFSIGVDEDSMRGLSIYDEFLPAITINARELPQARSFTLFHELAHLMLRAGGLCLEIGGRDSRGQAEWWCNRFAAATLVPKSEFEYHYADITDRTDDLERIFSSLGSSFRVSRHVVALRAERLGLVELGTYDQLATKWRTEDWVPARGTGGGDFYLTYKSRHGTEFIRLVGESLSARVIDRSQAAEVMEVGGDVAKRLISDVVPGFSPW